MQNPDAGISLNGMIRRHWMLLVAGYLLVLADPFGISSKSSQAISDGFDRLFSPFYDHALAAEGADLVDVILIDDPSIRRLSHEENGYLRANDWPLAYSDHLVLIDALRRLGYGTIILDITFYRARNLDNSLPLLVERLKHFRDHAGLSVVLSAGEDPNQLEPSIRPLTEAAADIGLVGWSGHDQHYPIRRTVADGTVVPTLAVAGYDIHCQKFPSRRCTTLSKAEDAWLMPRSSGMHLSWGMPAQRMAATLGCSARPADDSVFRSILQRGRYLFGAEVVSTDGQRPCPPVPTATLRDIFCTAPDCDPFFSQTALTNRIAIVGVSVPSARDLFDPPIPGRLPGVYLHAEALRNLLHYGADYLKPIGAEWNLAGIGLPGWTLPVDLLLSWPLILFLILMLARRVLAWRWRDESRAEWPELAVELAELVIIIVSLCLLYSVLLLFHRTPGFLADLIGLTPLLLIAVRKERKEMENERKTMALAACTAVQFGLGRNPIH
ncbi:CHASE2 domain-containing protein [Marinobacter sp. VGCF2001]|uniref:CHASE2 domain-containing protein n=1 Tax=Marinobacter sp. VGCF2001 TaxID=3417189 RepID=UPI003CF9C9EB